MPMYVYKCNGCQRDFTVKHKPGESLTVCPECGGLLRRVFTPVSIHFKCGGTSRPIAPKLSKP